MSEPTDQHRAFWARSKPVSEGGLDWERRWRRGYMEPTAARADAVAAAGDRGLTVVMTPEETFDGSTPGVTWDRDKWSADARKRYGTFESLLGKRYTIGPTKVEPVSLTPVYSMPSSWFQHLKWTLARRWPRAFGRLEVLWTQQWQVPG